VDGILFDKSRTTLIEYVVSKAGSYTVPNSVTSIRDYAFYGCGRLTSVTIPHSVTSIGTWAFYGCTGLAGVYFEGNAPSLGSDVFYGDTNAKVYYLAGTTGWGPTFGGRPTVVYAFPQTFQLGYILVAKAFSPTFSNLSLGTNYQMQVSSNMSTWTNQGSPFTATNANMVYPQYWDVDNWNSLFFRLQVSP
jgi:hypothetical protein